MKPPSFWSNPLSLWGLFLEPLGFLYNKIVQLRLRKHATKVSVPVICVGNATMGGSGKTPVTIYLAHLLKGYGYVPHILSRGYKATRPGPHLVDLEDTDVGDEPLLLAKAAPTWIGADRLKSALAAVQAGATVLIMDDGFQNPTLHKDISLLVMGEQGNQRVFPAGPLREKLNCAMTRANAIVWTIDPLFSFDPSFCATPSFNLPEAEGPVMAFAGIANPIRFFESLKKMGLEVVATKTYPDHHVFTETDLEDLKKLSQSLKAPLITTTKDYVRLPKKWREDVLQLEMEMILPPAFDAFIRRSLEAI